jgi:hypothetical protein
MNAFDANFDQATVEAVARIERHGGIVREIASESGTRRLDVRLAASCPQPDAVLAEVQHLQAQCRIHLHGSGASDEGIRRLAGTERLESIALEAEPRLTPQSLEYLPRSLRELTLCGGWVDDDWLPGVGKLRALLKLDLSNTRVSDGGLKAVAGLSRLQVLKLRNTDVTDRGIKQLARLKDLRSLSLEGAYTTAVGGEELRGQLPQIREIMPWWPAK